MISLVLSFAVLIIGYIVYGRVVERTFAPDDRKTPAYSKQDGVDFIPMPTWKAFLVQLLNIAGTGPIFGALMGACFGPVVFLWIIFGAVLGGGVHDYMCGMVSERHDGASIAELSGIYLGKGAKWVMRIFSVLLLLLTGTVFVTSPAALLARLTPDTLGTNFWIIAILVYYILATLLPIDKIIGRLYPVFGAVLIIMAAGIFGGIVIGGYAVPEITLADLHPENLPIWPFMFVTVACGAISGFHATQSPMVAKCITSEKLGRKVFYGAMLSESVIALIWAAGGVAFYGATGGLHGAISSLGQSGAVYDISTGMLGPVGGVLAIVGVIACPITSGDTAFRSARLILAEITKLDQKHILNRLIITLPLLAAGAVLTQLDFNVLWRYFSWSNQTLAMIALWVSTAYLLKTHENRRASLLTALPATFMSAVSMTYILMAQEGFRLGAGVAYPVGIVFAAVLFAVYVAAARKAKAPVPAVSYPTHAQPAGRDHEPKRMLAIICTVTLLGFLASIVVLVWRGMNHMADWLFLLVCIFYGFVLYYGVKGYRKPHGDMLRWLILILAVFVAASVLMQVERFGAAWPILLSNELAVLAMGFLAGRLHRVERNKYVTVFVSIMLLIRCFWFLEHPGLSGADAALFVLDRCQPIFMWLTMLLLYFYRYKEHKEAGLAVDVDDVGHEET